MRLKLAFWEGAKANTSMSEEKWHLYENKGEVFSGLYVYRDGFRVLPYGRTDFDFLEFEKIDQRVQVSTISVIEKCLVL